MKNFLPVAIIVFLFIVGGYFFLSKYNLNTVKIENNEIQTGSLPPLGNPSAPIKIIEFGDFLCPFCGEAVINLYPQIESLINEGKVVLYFRDFVVHPEAMIIHNASRCANEQGKYWEFNKTIFQKFMNGIETTKKENLIESAKELGLDIQSFEKCIDENRYYQNIQNDIKDGIDAKVEGTPTFFINGTKIEGINIPQIMSTINNLLNNPNIF